MSATVSEYMQVFREQFYPELFSFECVKTLDNIEKRYGDTECSQVIAEIPMSGEDRTLDYSIAVDTPEDLAPEYWHEMDYRDYAAGAKDGSQIPYSIFFNATPVVPGTGDNKSYLETIIPRLAGEELAEKLEPAFEKMLDTLSGRCTKLFQIGSMKSRGEVSSLRVEVWRMRRTHLIDFLNEFGWKGDIDQLNSFLREWVPAAGRFTLAFDLSEEGISDKIGIEISGRSRTISETEIILEKANRDGFLSENRYEAMLRWLQTPPQLEPLVQNDISHIKFTFLDGKVLSAKAYLRQSGLFLAEEAAFLSHPWQMNLELLDYCPLSCPQCFVHLNEGRQMSLETAKYWLREAAFAGVSCVSLSGGETACYPYLTEVISLCSELGLRSAVSFSGAGLTEQLLKQIVDAGVDEIYVSLNGSTQKINSMTRDGYEEAIAALELLKALDPDSTCRGINWVMHHNNSGDFSTMLKLCQEYGINKLVILSLKVDSKETLVDYPDSEDFQNVANIIKNYNGTVNIQVESCLSQLRALVYQGHLYNENTGLLRGCGAGRDRVSVTCEGKLIPCRHLNLAEEWGSISEYWEKSSILKNIRDVYYQPTGKCANCSLHMNCLPCIDIDYRLHGRINFSMDECPYN